MDALDFAELTCFNDVLCDDLACQIQLLPQSTRHSPLFFCPFSFFSHTDGKIQKGLFLNGAGSLKSDCSHQVCQSTLPVLGLNQAMQVVPGMFAEFFC